MSTSRDVDDRTPENGQTASANGEPGHGQSSFPAALPEAKEGVHERMAAASGPDSRVNGLQRSLFDDLSAALTRRAEERYVRRLSGEQLRRGVAELLNFVSQRAPGEIKVRAYVAHDVGVDPNEELVALETCMDDQPFIIDT